MIQAFLKPGHVQPVWAGHPWVFPQGIAKFEGRPEHGAEVQVLDARGKVMGYAFYSKDCPIALRVFSLDAKQPFSEKLLHQRLQDSVQMRAAFLLPQPGQTNAYRAFHGEGDGLAGLIVDRFDDVLVMQLGTAALSQRRELILDALQAVFSPRAILDRTTEKAARFEGFEVGAELARGQMPNELLAMERGMQFRLPMDLTQKTGFYFDQRPLREIVEKLSAGRRVLDAYSFVGAIGMSAKRGGATEVTCVDSSGPALELGAQIAAQNGLEIEFVKEKALNFFARFSGEHTESEESTARAERKASRTWDLVISDPPKLAQTRGGRDKAMRAFRKIAASTVAVTAPGGIAVLSSCSAALGIDQVERCLALGARDVGRTVRVFERVFQGADHPVPPAFAEGRYLSTVLAYVSD